MKSPKNTLVYGAIFVSVLGTLLHFLYGLSNHSFWVGLFTPINESTWEHMKLIFFPMLIFAVWTKKFRPSLTYSVLRGAVLGTLLIPIIFYTYTGVLGTHFALFDILTFYLSVFIAFLSIYKNLHRQHSRNTKNLLLGALIILLGLFIIFTITPPAFGIFAPPL